MKKFFPLFFLILFFNFYLPTNAGPWPKNYYKGKFYDSVKDFFLVASKTMKDPRFKNTVIVMFDNDESGAWGLVVNKPLASVPLSSLIHKSTNTTVKEKKLFNVKIPVYWGGPVNENRILILHSQEYKNETTKKDQKTLVLDQSDRKYGPMLVIHNHYTVIQLLLSSEIDSFEDTQLENPGFRGFRTG